MSSPSIRTILNWTSAAIQLVQGFFGKRPKLPPNPAIDPTLEEKTLPRCRRCNTPCTLCMREFMAGD